MQTGFNQFLLDLYGLIRAEPSQQFGSTALELLKRTLPFDTAIWGTFTATPEGPRPHFHHAHGFPQEMVDEYELVKQHDILSQQALANCGETVNISLPSVEGRAHPAIFAHARRWGMEHTLATMHLESPLNLYTAICLYRSDPARAFSEGERRDAQAAVPHLVQAWHINALHFLDVPSGRTHVASSARALVDRYGVLHNAEPGLTALFRQEDPSWEGPTIPKPLFAFFEDGSKQFKGDVVIASLVRQLADKTFVISVRARAPIDTLSRRELAVAREFAAGKTHKEIASAFGTSPATVRSQIQIVYEKLGVRSKVDLLKQVERTAG
jgi:DNA-binding CsgD family transcriptional regulator